MQLKRGGEDVLAWGSQRTRKITSSIVRTCSSFFFAWVAKEQK